MNSLNGLKTFPSKMNVHLHSLISKNSTHQWQKIFEDRQYYLPTTVRIPPKRYWRYIFRNSLLHHNDDSWVKKDTSVEFNVTMGSYNGVEVCEIVGIFIIDIMRKSFEKRIIGLYSDDVPSIFRNYNDHQNNKVRKDIMKLF